jgi:hypothetical protein
MHQQLGGPGHKNLQHPVLRDARRQGLGLGLRGIYLLLYNILQVIICICNVIYINVNAGDCGEATGNC